MTLPAVCVKGTQSECLCATPQMAVDDLVQQHIDPAAHPSAWRLTVPAPGSGGPHARLTEGELLEVGPTYSPDCFQPKAQPKPYKRPFL